MKGFISKTPPPLFLTRLAILVQPDTFFKCLGHRETPTSQEIPIPSVGRVLDISWNCTLFIKLIFIYN